MNNTIGVYPDNSVYICVDENTPVGFAGRIFYRGVDKPVTFSEVYEMTSAMEDFYDALNFPEAATSERSFKMSEKCASARKCLILDMNNDITSQAKGKKATFVVQASYRQNATWQGQVEWSEKALKRNFRSALELIKMIDRALD